MECEFFEKYIEEYLDGELEENIKNKLEEHMSQCETCKELYENEIFINDSFKEAFNIDGVEFKSCRKEVMNNIDKDRYNKTKVNKLLFYFKKNKLRYASVAAAITLCLFFTNSFITSYKNYPYSKDKKQGHAIIGDVAKKKSIDTNKESQSNKKNQSEVLPEAAAIKDTKETNQDKQSILDESHSVRKQSNGDEKQPLDFVLSIIGEAKDKNVDNKLKNSNKNKLYALGNVRTEKDLVEVNINNGVKLDENKHESKDLNNNLNNNLNENKSIKLQEKANSQEEILPNSILGKINTLNKLTTMTRKELDFSKELKQHTMWKASPENNYLACIEGLDTDLKLYNMEFSKEQQEVKIIISDKGSKKFYEYIVSQNSVEKGIPKLIDWWDEHNLLVVIKNYKGDAICREGVYMLNVKSGYLIEVYSFEDNAQRIVDVYRNGNNLELRILVHDDKFVYHYENRVVYNYEGN